MKSFSQVVKELDAADEKRNKRLLLHEKELYALWRSRKSNAIENARRCKRLGYTELQMKFQSLVVKYDHYAKDSKQNIRKIGKQIYG